jgi:hypothetical protein
MACFLFWLVDWSLFGVGEAAMGGGYLLAHNLAAIGNVLAGCPRIFGEHAFVK